MSIKTTSRVVGKTQTRENVKTLELPAVTRSRFSGEHPVAPAARRLCRGLHRVTGHALVGKVACASCWEEAIRADERIVREFELPEDVTPDPDYLDWVAIERFISGDPVPLTRAERREVTRRLLGAGQLKGVAA